MVTLTPYYRDRALVLFHGDVLDTLRQMPAESVQCVVTSPPYWALRDYGTGTWDGGDPACDHKPRGKSRATRPLGALHGGTDTIDAASPLKGRCHCGATRVDQQIGLEDTPEAYVTRMVEVFREVRRVLRADGTLWLNIGDSYANTGSAQAAWSTPLEQNKKRSIAASLPSKYLSDGLKPKDLVGIPWRVAFALQADGWYLRQDIIWHKPNPMPESVRDRCTKAHEYVFLLSKSERYYYDQDAIREPHAEPWRGRGEHESATPHNGRTDGGEQAAYTVAIRRYNDLGRNKRSVWTIPTAPFSEAHFATFPEALVRPCILAGSREGDTVLDPFLGSGTTALVAKRLGRRVVGIDLSAEYLDMARRRCENMADALDIEDYARRQVEVPTKRARRAPVGYAALAAKGYAIDPIDNLPAQA